MTKQILVNATPFETRVAVLENSTLVELHIERTRERGIAGNIYKGRVLRVLPGMQAAFLDIGLEKAAFLHVSDLLAEPETVPTAVGGEDAGEEGEIEFARRRGRRGRRPPIEEQLKKGQELLVQVAKEPIGGKGARVTSQFSLPGRYLVYMPTTSHIGISRRIEDASERTRLREIVESERPAEGGLIVRTACEGVSKREIHADVRFLTRLWTRIRTQAEATPAPALIHADLDLALRAVRDLFAADVERLVVDCPDNHARIVEFAENLMPRFRARIELYDGSEPLFDAYGVEAKIARALERRVWLKSGGYIVVDQTEALTTIDVNTGRYVGKRDQEETVLRTNLEAVKVIVEQLRLRNLGGIIIVDFIDMEKPANRKKVFDAFADALRRDKARTNVLRISELGLVEMTRKRTRESLQRVLMSPCPRCNGRGKVKSAETVAHDILRRLYHSAAGLREAQRLVLEVHPDVANYLHDEERQSLEAVERSIGKPVVVKADSSLDPEQYEVRALN